MGGMVARDPVATMTALRASRVSTPTSTVRSPVTFASPRMSVTPLSSSHGSCEESSRSWMISSRRLSVAVTSSEPVTASRAPTTRPTSASASAGRSSALEGMHAQ